VWTEHSFISIASAFTMYFFLDILRQTTITVHRACCIKEQTLCMVVVACWNRCLLLH
jgi:hypothetical protein